MDTLQKIQKLMEQRGWTEYRLAKESNLPVSTVTNMFHRQTAPTIPTLEMICSGFGITLSQFFAEQEFLVELTNEQLSMFRQWSALTKRQKELIAELIDNMK